MAAASCLTKNSGSQRRRLAKHIRQVIDVVLEVARDVYAEVAKDSPGTARSAAAGFPEPVMQVAFSRRTFGILPMRNPVIAEQQKIADTFKEHRLIPAAINVLDAMRKPGF